MERIQKRIARSGYCSRRSAEALVADGRVTVNGQLAHIGQHVAVDDEIRIDGAMLGGEPAPVYLKVNKPVGYVCSHRSQGGAPTVFDLVDHDTRLTAVGRLDKDSRGLVVLTNDGELVNQLTHPSFAHEKAYEVTVSGIADLAAASSALQRGVSISSSERVRAAKVDVLNDDTLAIVLRQGKNRQIRRMIAALGGCVDDLVRVRIATLELGSLAEGEWASIAPVAIEQLRMSSTVRIDSEYGPVHR